MLPWDAVVVTQTVLDWTLSLMGFIGAYFQRSVHRIAVLAIPKSLGILTGIFDCFLLSMGTFPCQIKDFNWVSQINRLSFKKYTSKSPFCVWNE